MKLALGRALRCSFARCFGMIEVITIHDIKVNRRGVPSTRHKESTSWLLVVSKSRGWVGLTGVHCFVQCGQCRIAAGLYMVVFRDEKSSPAGNVEGTWSLSVVDPTPRSATPHATRSPPHATGTRLDPLSTPPLHPGLATAEPSKSKPWGFFLIFFWSLAHNLKLHPSTVKRATHRAT